jgi:hypothetical protein
MSARLLLASFCVAHGFHVLPSVPITATTAQQRALPPVAGLFDGVFGETEEQKRAKDEQLAAMKAMQELRRDPDKWEESINVRRNKEAQLKKAQAMQAAGVLPEGWGAAQDADGDTYYFKLDTKETQWEYPVEAC